MLTIEAHKLGLTVEVFDSVQAESPGTLNSCKLKFKGNIPDAFISEWQGTVQWIAQSPYRSTHKRKNWFIGIEVLDNASKISWDKAEVSYETFRASGPGGQNVNKVESAVRIRHNGTGIQIQVMDSRSQLENKKIALRRLTQKIEDLQNKQSSQLLQNTWTEHNSLERGNPVRVIRKPL
jgi:peptide chain release factor